jgi:dipeptidyl aminopeptidase/acylaminoacyl peptidase
MFLAATFVFLASGIDARGDGGLTPEHVAKLRGVGSVSMSPDGQYVAYTLSVPRKPFEDDNGGNWSELHVVGPTGESRPYITGKVSVRSIAWTPDGKGISFRAKRGDDKHTSLYVIPIDGGEAKNVFSHETSIGSYTWSPDGKRVAFIATDKEDKDKKKLKDKGFVQEVYEEEFRQRRVYIATPGSDDDAEPMDLPGFPSELHWAPVGSQIAMAISPSPLIDDHYMKRKVHIYDADNGGIVSSFQNPGKLGQIDWSPDGKYLAIISAEDLNDPSAGRLMIADPNDGSLKDILPNYMGQVGAIAWHNNKTLLFLGDEGVWTTLQEIGRDGSGQETVVPVKKMVATSFSISRGGQAAAMVVESATHPREVYVMRHGDAGPQRMTDSNPWLKDVRLAKQEVIRYKARNGVEIEGILVRPLDEKPGQRYPLILAVHGGPESHYHNSWLTRYSGAGQMAAARGYFVFYQNYRGSTGRGVEFSKAGQGDYAGAEFDDLVDGVDYLVGKGWVDTKKVGVTGGSYGGFATAWCSTYYSHRFAAGVMFVGISDHVSKVGTTDIPNEMFLVHARKKLYGHWDFYRERSPIYHAEKGKTPLLIMHGKDDTRVHPSQSMELYRNLKNLGQTPVRLVWYPGEGHGNRKAASKFDYSLRMLRWFDHYLKGDGGAPPPVEVDYGELGAKKDDEKEKS